MEHGEHGGYSEHAEKGHETLARHHQWFKSALEQTSRLYPDFSRPGALGVGIGAAMLTGFTGPVGFLLSIKAAEWATKSAKPKGKKEDIVHGGGHH